jgi:hypothetical protein
MVKKVSGPKTGLSGFPYEAQRETPVWKIVDRAINDLVDNKDIVETTHRDYIVGYICKKLEPLFPGSSV